MAQSNVNPYPLTVEEFKTICFRNSLSPWDAVKKAYITKDDYTNLSKRGRVSKAVGRCLFFFVRDEGLL